MKNALGRKISSWNKWVRIFLLNESEWENENQPKLVICFKRFQMHQKEKQPRSFAFILEIKEAIWLNLPTLLKILCYESSKLKFIQQSEMEHSFNSVIHPDF